jgi:formylglycine-generating enzyme
MTRYPREFPPSFASACGDDEFGIWADLTVKGVTQRFRWIEAGEFLMGSPADEADRFDNEGPQHRVRITEGFWLADSACSQAFWLAVMGGENPSRFNQDLNCPVERVSFDDVERFLTQLQTRLPDAWIAALPSEAQWEYACRAGTKTAFSFGAKIAFEQVNYYGGAKALRRQTTVQVKSLPANSWGLFEMHGNVWEWCRDGKRTYSDGYDSNSEDQSRSARVDPVGPVDSVGRALRGGSRIDGEWAARSAFRYANSKDSRNFDVGFRILLMPKAHASALHET